MSKVSREPGSVTRAIRKAQHGLGEDEAFTDLMERYREMVKHKASRRVGRLGIADASDVVIDVFSSIFRGLPDGKYPCKDRQEFEELLSKVTFHKAIDLWNECHRSKRHPSEKLSDEEILERHSLKAPHRKVAKLHFLHGKTHTEIGAELGLSQEQVQHCLTEIRTWLNKHRYRPTQHAASEAIKNIASDDCPLDILIVEEVVNSLDETLANSAETVRLWMQGLETDEIAERLDVSVRQVQRRLKSAKDVLHERLRGNID